MILIPEKTGFKTKATSVTRQERQQFHNWVSIKGTENTNLKRCINLYVHCSIICKGEDMEVT